MSIISESNLHLSSSARDGPFGLDGSVLGSHGIMLFKHSPLSAGQLNIDMIAQRA